MICNVCGRDHDARDVAPIFGKWVCRHCAPNVIHGYHRYSSEWRPMPACDDPTKMRFPYIGVELEISDGGEYSINAIKITDAMGHNAAENNDVTCSHDGSVPDGFELISQPATYEIHINWYGWRQGMARAVELGYNSHNGGHCGLHCHVDRAYFGKTDEVIEKSLAVIFHNNAAWLKQFSRRADFGYCHFHTDWSEFHTGQYAGERFTPETMQAQRSMLNRICRIYKHGGHGVALNNENRHTVEFRFFRGTLKYNVFVASLQLVNMISFAAKHFTYKQLADVRQEWFLNFAKVNNYTEFVNEYYTRCA